MPEKRNRGIVKTCGSAGDPVPSATLTYATSPMGGGHLASFGRDCCIEPSGEADTTDLPVGSSSRHVSDGAIKAQSITKEMRFSG